MKSFKTLVTEIKKLDTIVLAFGRMSPPTRGHGLLVQSVENIARENRAQYAIYLSRTKDQVKNPLDVESKVRWARKMFKDQNIFGANDKIRTFIELIKSYDGKVKNVIFVAGSDRVEEYTRILNKYNGKEFNFDSVKVVSAGERDPDAEGVAGMSATKMRKAALANDVSAFTKGTINLTKDEVLALMKEVRTGLGAKSGPGDSIREQFFRNEKYRIGDIVKDSAGSYEILDRGSNYVTVVNETGVMSKKFIDAISITEDATIPAHVNQATFSFKGYTPSKQFLHNEQAVAAFRETVQRYEDGKITDAVAILKALKAVDQFISGSTSIIANPNSQEYGSLQDNLTIAHKSLARIGEYMHHIEYLDQIAQTLAVSEVPNEPVEESMEKIKQGDKLKVAYIIADTFGVDTSGTNPELMVNMAIRAAKKKPGFTKHGGEEILNRMLSLAYEVGIKYDQKLVEEKIDELAPETVQSYLDKVKGAKVSHKKDPLKAAINHFKGAERAQDRIHKKELKKIEESCKVGDLVLVDGKSSGRVKAIHGGVFEVSHRNGKIGFYHSNRVQLNELEEMDEYECKDFSEVVPKFEPHTKEGHGLRYSDETHRKQLVHKLKDL